MESVSTASISVAVENVDGVGEGGGELLGAFHILFQPGRQLGFKITQLRFGTGMGLIVRWRTGIVQILTSRGSR